MDDLTAVPRRGLIGAGGLGITTLLLPGAAAAVSPAGDGDGLSAPSITGATPSGHVGSGTGAVTLAWGSVPNATSYVVAWSTMSVNGPFSGGSRTTSATSIEVDGLAGTDTDHHFVVTAYRDATPSAASSAVTASPVVASGGDVTTFEGDGTIGDLGTTYVVHTFTYGVDDGSGRTAATLRVNEPRALDYLIVGGGGGGGGNRGRSFNCGGGGGGEVLTGARDLASSTPGELLTVLVGRGGTGGGESTSGPYAEIGRSSTFLGTIARGGGAGGSAQDSSGDPPAAAYPSGSDAGAATGGGGAAQAQVNQSGAEGVLGDGGAGSPSFTIPLQRAGGGGGAGGDGTAGSSKVSGDGGSGVASSLSGVARAYGAGGGGGKRSDSDGATAAGLGGLTSGPGERVGGAGGRDGPGANGTSGRGGGGGGGGNSGAGGDGGSGVVVVRYAL